MPEPYSVQRLNGRYVMRYRDAESGLLNGPRRVLDASDRNSAEAEARAKHAGAQRGRWSVGSIVLGYIDARQVAEIASTGRQRDAWKAMSAFWADVSPASIDETMCKGYAAQRRAGPATIRYELSMLGVALRWAEQNRHVARAPKIWRPQPPERKTRHLTHAEFRAFIAEVIAPHAQLYMVLGVATCARPSAILDLTWDRVDLTRGVINLNPAGRVQTMKRRPVVPIADYAMQPLRDAYAARQSNYVIEFGGKRLACIKKAFQAASQRSGVHATAYTLRHTGAVWRAEAGVPMAELAQLMGHTSPNVTFAVYARFSPDHLRAAANAGGFSA